MNRGTIPASEPAPHTCRLTCYLQPAIAGNQGQVSKGKIPSPILYPPSKQAFECQCRYGSQSVPKESVLKSPTLLRQQPSTHLPDLPLTTESVLPNHRNAAPLLYHIPPPLLYNTIPPPSPYLDSALSRQSRGSRPIEI